jgi:hypothetical protein
MDAKWTASLVGAVILFSALVVLCFSYGSMSSQDDPGSRIDERRQALDVANSLWENDKRFEGIKKYKAILRSEERIHLHRDLPMIYRRVIEHEAEYGDPAEARDWSWKAYEEWPGMRMQLTFESTKATDIWKQVVEASDRRERLWRKRNGLSQ